MVTWSYYLPSMTKFLFILIYFFKLIQLDDPFTYNSLNDLVRAIESPDVPVLPLRREFDSNIVVLLGQMLVKVRFFFFVYVMSAL
jgi:hypothetical protein